MDQKKRCTNFSTSEEKHLLELVHKYRDKIENKKTDTDANRLKKNTWQTIEKEFNITGFENYRSAMILKRKYDNVKKRTKAKFADEKKYTLGTGGGPAKSTHITSNDEVIRDIIGEQLTGRTSKYDNDTLGIAEESAINLSAEIEETSATFPLLEETENDEMSHRGSAQLLRRSQETLQTAIQPETSSSSIPEFVEESMNNDPIDWGSYSADKLRTPKSAALKRKVKKHGSLSKRICDWVENKSEMEDSRREFIIEEQKLRIAHIKEIHELTIEHMKEKHQLHVQECKLKMKILEDEHLYKMKSNCS